MCLSRSTLGYAIGVHRSPQEGHIKSIKVYAALKYITNLSNMPKPQLSMVLNFRDLC